MAQLIFPVKHFFLKRRLELPFANIELYKSSVQEAKGCDQIQSKKQSSRKSEGNKGLWGSIFLKEYIEFLVLD